MDLNERRESGNVVDARHKSRNREIDSAINRKLMNGNPHSQYGEIIEKLNERNGFQRQQMKDMSELEFQQEDKAYDNLESESESRRKKRTPSPARKDNTNVNIGRRRSLEGEDLGEYKMRSK